MSLGEADRGRGLGGVTKQRSGAGRVLWDPNDRGREIGTVRMAALARQVHTPCRWARGIYLRRILNDTLGEHGKNAWYLEKKDDLG